MSGLLVSMLLMLLLGIVVIPFIILGVVAGALLYIVGNLVLLPLRLLGAASGLGAGVILGVAKLFVLLLIGVFGVIGLILGLLPFLSVLLIFLGIWLLLRPARVPRSHRPVAT